MAFTYDYMANPEFGYEDEETRRRRLAQQQAQPATQVAPVAPVAPPKLETIPDANYTAQMESGGNYNIGRHGPNTTATGAYGITAPAFQDVQRSDPYFANKNLDQLTPEEQTRAYSVVRQNNAGYLQNFGVEPTDANLRLAHFLGAKGAADYIKEGKVSPEAARFNGGEENVRRIADARLQGQSAPSSGAAQRPQPVAPVAPQAPSQFDLTQGMGGQGLRMPGVQLGQQVQPDVTRTAIDAYQKFQDNPQDLLRLRSDESAPEWMRRRAADRAYELMDQEVKQRQAQEQVQQLTQGVAQGDPKASREMSKLLGQQEGSWAKYILLGFISPDLAKEEAIKLGFGNKWQAAQTADGTGGLIEYNARGLPLRGVKADGTEMSQKELISYAASAGAGKETQVEAGTYADPTGKIKGNWMLERRPGGSVFRQVGTNQVATPEQANALRKLGTQGTFEDQRTRTIQDINLRLQGKGVEEQMTILRNYNQQLVAAGYPPVQPGEVGISVPQIGGGAAAPAQPAAAARPLPAQAAPSMADQVASGRPVAPGQAPAARPAPAQAAAAARPTGPQLEAQAAGAKEEARIVGEDIGKLRAGIGRAERSADYLLTKIDQLLTHPGFEVSVGASVQPGFQFIPGTDKADWYARFSEVQGQQFLQAIEQMRGTGSITEREGEAAKQAISRMSTSQSEAEFKRAAQDFQNIIKRGIDASREKLGRDTKYGTAPESELAADQNTGTTRSGNKFKRVQ